MDRGSVSSASAGPVLGYVVTLGRLETRTLEAGGVAGDVLRRAIVRKLRALPFLHAGAYVEIYASKDRGGHILDEIELDGGASAWWGNHD